MPQIKSGTFRWDAAKIACALKIKEADVLEYFRDGRRVSFITERRLCEAIGGTLANSEGAAYDLTDPNGGKWEVRSITKGVYFCPSYMVGSGRKFNKLGFLQKLEEIEGYILCHVTKFPEIPYWFIPKELVRKWYDAGKLGKESKVGAIQILRLIEEIYE